MLGYTSGFMVMFLWLEFCSYDRSSWTLCQANYVTYNHQQQAISGIQYLWWMFSIRSQSLIFQPWDIYKRRMSHYRSFDHIYFHIQIFSSWPMCQIPSACTAYSSGKFCLIVICIKMTSPTIVFVVMLLCWVSIFPDKSKSTICFWYLLATMISNDLWIVTSLLAAYLEIQSYIGMPFLVLIGSLC